MAKPGRAVRMGSYGPNLQTVLYVVCRSRAVQQIGLLVATTGVGVEAEAESRLVQKEGPG